MTPRIAALVLLAALASSARANDQMLGFIDVKQWCAIDLPKADGKEVKIDNAKVRRIYADAAGLTGNDEDRNKTKVGADMKPMFCRIGTLVGFNAAVGEFTKLAKDSDISVKNSRKFEPMVQFYAETLSVFSCGAPKADKEEIEGLRRDYTKILKAYLTRPIASEYMGLGKPTTTREAAAASLTSVAYHITSSGKILGDENCPRGVLLAENDALKNEALAISKTAK
ncbi:MAG: hypothetical protein M0D55_06335 [Elusimicrobiota bacterium]|nr:MAG: hypothetical protein M0D55_06335 [Elusimicrobiota bacterium]